MMPTLYPQPRRIRARKSEINLQGRSCMRLRNTHSDRFEAALLRFLATVAQAGSVTYQEIPDSESLLDIAIDGAIKGEESYSLELSAAGFRLRAGFETGLYRGLCSIEQILTNSPKSLAAFSLQDEPAFPNRGVMLDISRCKVPTLATLEALIDQLAGLKYNQLQLYTEHTFAFVHHRRVWAESSPMTASDILHIKQYAADRYIELVPNQNSFGHFERWLRYPEYHQFAECPDGFAHPLNGSFMPHGSTLRPSRGSLKLIDELHGELLPLYDSAYFNVGGDEPWELGLGWSKARCQDKGTTQVYVDFLHNIQKLVAKRGRRMMFWSDIVLKEPASLQSLSRDLIALNWGYEADHPFRKECRHMAQLNIPFYVCPGTSSWNSLTGRMANLSGNLANAAKQGQQHGAEGFLVTDWGDHGHHQYLPISYPGFALGACHAWNPQASRNIDLTDLLNRTFLRGEHPDVASILKGLGDAASLIPSPLRNATMFNRLLFWSMKHEPSVAAAVTNPQLKRADARLSDLLTELEHLPQTLVTRELHNAAALARQGPRRLLMFRGDSQASTDLGGDQRAQMAQHADLWLARNRPGGLPESLSHLQSSLDALGK